MTWRLEPDADPASVDVDGTVLDQLVESFDKGLGSGDLCAGAAMAMHRHGRKVLDIGGGIARRRFGSEVTPDTMFVIFSATKGLAALVMLMLHERGAMHFDEPLVKYWPSFASLVPGKASVTIRQVMGHRGGFPAGPAWFTARHWHDRDAIRRAMEEVPLAWTPGEKNGYHAMNFGHALNELVERIDGRDMGRFFADEVAKPLGLQDLYIGLPDEDALEDRVAWFEETRAPLSAAQSAGLAPDETGAPARLRAEPSAAHADTPELSEPFNRPIVHRSVLPAGGGIGTAGDLARMYAALAAGGEGLVSTEGLRHCTTPTTRPGEIDQSLKVAMRWGTGWHMGSAAEGASSRTFGHGGRGGQTGMADPDRELAIAFVSTGQLDPAAYTRWRTELESLALRACR